MAQSPEGLALVSLCRALRISCHTSWHPSVRAMNPPPMATELTRCDPLRESARLFLWFLGKRQRPSWAAWRSQASPRTPRAWSPRRRSVWLASVPRTSRAQTRVILIPSPPTTRWTPPASPTSSTRTTRWGTSAPSWTCRPASSCAPTRRILRRSSPRRSRTTIPRAPISTQRWPIAFVSRRSAWTTASSGSTTLKSQPTPAAAVSTWGRSRRLPTRSACKITSGDSARTLSRQRTARRPPAARQPRA